MATQRTAYECDKCGSIHARAPWAVGCCPNDYTVIEAFKCGRCGTLHKTEKAANECCEGEG